MIFNLHGKQGNLDVNGQQFLGGTAFDMTDRQQIEESLRQNTAKLRQALEYETILKRITDKVRDSLDESNILQAAVQELGVGLGIRSCNAALYDLEAGTSTISYEYTTSMFPLKGRVSLIANYPEIYNQLLQGHYFQFCFVQPNPVRGQVAIIACPIVDDQGVLGDLWLINDKDYAFRDLELRVVQQVANQCAIAIRQARLYQAAQAQVEELERLNRLKDDFLSTVSHELRTPMTNIKMAAQMLEITLKRAGYLESEHVKIDRYFHILHSECERETNLINDLLDLSRLEAEAKSLVFTPIAPHEWIPPIVEPFRERATQQQQQLDLMIPSALPPLNTVPGELERVLTELLNNACKYTPPQERIVVAVDTSGSELTLSISNSGVELAQVELERIFERFYRVPNNDPWRFGGTGLGLALVKKRVERLGAVIQVESDRGKTTFTIHFPENSLLVQAS